MEKGLGQGKVENDCSITPINGHTKTQFPSQEPSPVNPQLARTLTFLTFTPSCQLCSPRKHYNFHPPVSAFQVTRSNYQPAPPGRAILLIMMDRHISYLTSQLRVWKPPFTISSLLHVVTEALSERLSTGLCDVKATLSCQVFSFKINYKYHMPKFQRKSGYTDKVHKMGNPSKK